jgi:tRNA dimethylallyltransferase
VTVFALRSQRVVGRGAPKEGGRELAEIFAIFGPTASGKSALAELLAERLATGVVSADALQVYRGLEILTNQPSYATRLVAVRELTDEMSVGEYAELAHAALDELVASNGAAVLTGGTGLYFRAALADLGIPPVVEPDARARWERMYDADPAGAFDALRRLDRAAASALHANDRRRVVRALELAESGSSLVPASGRLWTDDMRRSTIVFGLDVPSDVLEARIRERVSDMLARGAMDEARRALARGPSRTAEKAFGLHELATLEPEAAKERIVVRTRRYAAYQRKWMRRIPGIVVLDGTRAPDDLVDEILDLARAR